MTSSNSSLLLGWLQVLGDRALESMLISTCLTLPFVLLYGIEIGILVANWRTLKSSFFSLLILRAIFDLLHFGFSFLNMRLPLMALFHDWFAGLAGWLLCIFYWSKSYLLSASNLTTVFMMINRWTAIAMPLRHNMLWERFLPFCVLLNICIPLTYTGHMFGYTVYVKMQADKHTFMLWDTGIDTGNKPNDTLIVGATMLGFMLLTLAINMAVLHSFLHNKTPIITSQNHGQQKARLERKMTIYAVITFAAHFLNAFYYFLLYLGFYQFAAFGWCADQTCLLVSLAILGQNCLVDDISHRIVPAILLLWASDPIRFNFGRILANLKLCENARQPAPISNDTNRWATISTHNRLIANNNSNCQYIENTRPVRSQ